MAPFFSELPDHPGAAGLSVVFASRPYQVPPASPDESYDDLQVWRTRTALFLRHGGVQARVSDRRASLGGDDDDLREPLRYILPFTLGHLLAPQGRIVVHAAALEKAGTAVLVFGATGSGKSTAVLAGLRSGWHALSDDLVVLRNGNAGLEVCGLPKPMAVPPELVEITERGCDPIPGDKRCRWVVRGQHWQRGWHRVAACLVTGHAERSPGYLRPLGASSLFTTVLVSFPGPAEPSAVRQLFPVAAALSRLPAWELGHDPDTVRRLATAARLITEAWAQLPDRARALR